MDKREKCAELVQNIVCSNNLSVNELRAVLENVLKITELTGKGSGPNTANA